MTDRRVRVLHRGSDGEAASEPILKALDERTIEVRLADGQPDADTQLVAEAAVDLLSRVFPRIKVTCSPTAKRDERLPCGAEMLGEHLELVRGHGAKPQPPGTSDVTLHVGPGNDAADLYADGAGWQSYIGVSPSQLPRAGESAPIGPLAAACRASAWAYQLAVHDLIPANEPPARMYSSGLDHTNATDPLPIATQDWNPHIEAVLVGAGSIGGAAVYAFARTPRLSGRIEIVDPQRLVDTNFDRAILATAEISATEAVKAEVAVESLKHCTDLDATPHAMTIEDFVASGPREEVLPLTLCAVDSLEARRSIQDCLPLELINAACDPANSVVSGHRTGAGPCVMCLFMKRMMDREQALFRMISRSTGLNERMVIPMMTMQAPLASDLLRGIERFRDLPNGALDEYAGRTLRELWDGEIVYGGHRIQTESGAMVSVAAPWVTALAGFLLASEALKAGAPAFQGYRLGPSRLEAASRYAESPYASPEFAQLTQPPRWEGEQCLCNSPRRRRLIIERYDLASDDYSI